MYASACTLNMLMIPNSVMAVRLDAQAGYGMDLGLGGLGKSNPIQKLVSVDRDAERSSVSGLPKRFPSRYTPTSDVRVLRSDGHGPAKSSAPVDQV